MRLVVKDNDRHLFKSLMANKDFRDWINYPTENRNQYWEKWIKVNEDKRELVNEARNAVLKLRFKEDYLDSDRLEGILTSIISEQDSSGRQHHNTPRKKSDNRSKWWFMTAASFAIMAVFLVLLRPWESRGSITGTHLIRTIKNPEGRKSKVRLPDGTMVNLNSGSSLSFPTKFPDSLRWVELDGEAYFEVVEYNERPFLVKTDGLEVRVLGTTFNVDAYKTDEETGIALLTGKVMINTQSPNGTPSTQLLLPGEKFQYNKSSFVFKKTRFQAIDEVGWKDGVLAFQNTSFRDFVKVLERWYGVEIEVQKMPSKEWNVNGHFKHESLEELLIGVQFTHGISYYIENKKVKISCE